MDPLKWKFEMKNFFQMLTFQVSIPRRSEPGLAKIYLGNFVGYYLESKRERQRVSSVTIAQNVQKSGFTKKTLREGKRQQPRLTIL